jgi:GNAT superfamily N-acetyltransferase
MQSIILVEETSTDSGGVMKTARALALRCVPATADRWDDLEELFGSRGACGGCWCMAWRKRKKDFDAGKYEVNRRALKKLTASKVPPGVLLYSGDEVVGWCSIAPRTEFVRLEASRVLAPVDDKPVWSVSCFFVKKGFRNQGLSVELLNGAMEFARKHGAKIIEGYPNDLTDTLPDAFVWTGLMGSYKRAGFKEAVRRSAAKPIVRKELK